LHRGCHEILLIHKILYIRGLKITWEVLRNAKLGQNASKAAGARAFCQGFGLPAGAGPLNRIASPFVFAAHPDPLTI
jgi:hypothetical protein